MEALAKLALLNTVHISQELDFPERNSARSARHLALERVGQLPSVDMTVSTEKNGDNYRKKTGERRPERGPSESSGWWEWVLDL